MPLFSDRPGRPYHLRTALVLVAAAFLLSACASSDENGSPAQQMRTWESASGFPGDTSTLRADLKKVTTVERDHAGTKILRGVCAALLEDAETANGELPTPDTKVTDLLSTAYDDLGNAANTCYDGAMDRSTQYRSRGSSALSEAQTRIETITSAAR